jgi:signal transduction histidine kinase
MRARFRAVLEERNRVAREMHDTVIQGCAGISALLEAEASLEQSDPACRRELLDCARTQVRVTVDEARRAVWNLRQDGKRSPEIRPLLDQIAREAGYSSSVPVRVATSGKAVPLDPAVEHDILMVAREATSNAVRHAKAREVRLEVAFEPECVRLHVEDDGCGFCPEDALSARGEHFGLVGMRERVERLGGNFRLRSGPGQGTHLSVEVPVRSAANAKLGIEWNE